MSLQRYLRRVLEARATLARDHARELMQGILDGEVSDLQLAALLGALAVRGETPAELAGFLDAIRAASTSIPLTDAERSLLVDTCGTGADSSGTFNISTAAALVTAAAGQAASSGTPRLMVAKHGNRAVTSACGSADVLEALGIPVALAPEQALRALRTYGFAFLHAPAHHPALKAVIPVRRALGVRTVFNILGPLANPAGARAQVMGVYSARLVPLVAETMNLLGVRHAFVVYGETSPPGHTVAAADPPGAAPTPPPSMDELSISGPSHLAEVHAGAFTLHRITPEDVGLRTAPISDLQGGDAAANAAILRAIFAGEPGPARDVVLLNAAAALVAGGVVAPAASGLLPTLRAAITLAAAAVDSGAVTRLLDQLSASTA